MATLDQDRPAATLGWSPATVLRATEGTFLGGAAAPAEKGERFDAVGIDSRRIGAGDIFVAIRGERFDGHDFASAAVEAGARLVIACRDRAGALPWEKWERCGVRTVVVDDTVAALGRMARFRRLELSAKVVAITGSNGKTSTKEMTAAVLRQRFTILATRGNLNNEIGLPLTLLGLGPGHPWAVLELGMNHPGEMRRLGRICLPDTAVITNIGRAHLEGLKTLDGVAAAKGELLESIRPEGVAVLNADDPRLRRLAAGAGQAVLWFGSAGDAQVRAEEIRPLGWGSTFTLVLPAGKIRVELRAPGRFMVDNALAAAAVGFQAGLSPEEIREGLAAFRPAAGRMQVEKTAGGLFVIDDTYNANPDSMGAAIETLASLAGTSPCLLIAGDMRELGPGADELHREIGRQAAGAGVSRLLLTGHLAESIRAGAEQAGMPAADIHAGDAEDLLKKAREWLKPGDWVLVKGSRAMGMERIAMALKTDPGGSN